VGPALHQRIDIRRSIKNGGLKGSKKVVVDGGKSKAHGLRSMGLLF
jgi:hypothetical protein